MKVIFVSRGNGGTRSIKLGVWSGAFISVCLVCLIGAPLGAYISYLKAVNHKNSDLLTSDIAESWSKTLSEQDIQIAQARERAEARIAALTLRVAELQARLVRLDALGERLTSMAKLEDGEFDFAQAPALGGPEVEILEDVFAPPEFASVMDELAGQIENRQHQLETLEALLTNRKLESDVFVAGRPVKKGWMSSRFGRRTDPFTGRVGWHSGVDFAAKPGTEIYAVAAGVVTWSDKRGGYGNLVEINHGNGFKTRYAHCKENLVKVGDVVKKGQVIALVGSTGRSTGPHVHFEVYKHGRAVDPATYIHRASR